MPAAYKKLVKEVVASTPKQYFPPNEDGEGRTVQTGRLVGNILNGGSKSTGETFGSVKEAIDALPEEVQPVAAGLATDLVELSYLKGVKDVRVASAKEFGDEDAKQVGARIDAQIAEVESSVRDGIASLPRSIGSDIAKRVNNAVKDADDDAQKRRGEEIQATDTRGMKRILNEIYEGLLPAKTSRAQSELLPAPPRPRTRSKQGSSIDLSTSAPEPRSPDRPGYDGTFPRSLPTYDGTVKPRNRKAGEI
jgi:hypothetical protein